MRISRRLPDRLLGVDRPVGRHVEVQLVVVGALADTCGLDVVRDAPHRREDRVDRDHADRVLRPAVQLARDVPAAAADRHRHLEAALVGQRRDLKIRVQDLEVGGRLDVAGRDLAWALLVQPHLDLGRLALEAHDHVLELQDDVGHVFLHARQRRELVRGSLELDRGDGGALERGEQHAAQRVAERVAEAAVERLDREPAALLVHFLVDDPRHLELHQRRSCCHVILSTSSRARRSVIPGRACRSPNARGASGSCP